MGDGLKLSKASISEMADQFATAEVRCDDLQDKIDLIKSLKRKRKLKKRSMTKVTEPPTIPENVPFISVRTQPKKTLLITEVSQQAARLRRLEVPPNPTRGYLDPATVEQHRMISQVRGYNQAFKPQQERSGQTPSSTVDQRQFPKHRQQRSQADNDSLGGRSQPLNEVLEVASGQDITGEEYSNAGLHNRLSEYPVVAPKKTTDLRQLKQTTNRRRHVPRETILKEVGADQVIDPWQAGAQGEQPVNRPRRKSTKSHQSAGDDQPVVELFNKSQNGPTHVRRVAAAPTAPAPLESLATHDKKTKKGLGHVPTYGPKSADVVSINDNKKIMLFMKLRLLFILICSEAVDCYIIDLQEPSLDHREINAIRVGRRLLRLPSYKYMSYNQLLSLYREGDGMVPRFLRAISRPHYFYTSMYNLATNREDFDGATSKGRGGNQEAKQSLAEYASLYREYEQVDKCIKEGNFEPELERRRDELTRELASREEHIRRVVQEYRTGGEADPILRASASTAEDGYRHSTFKLGDVQQ
ncbi:hypothetical protein HF086_004462 [Spodoptera exigua]|uniref:Uncharacterized protein n=1 Tax=Spodoptera exigua TaxID=7107 RepID=A0A922M4U2_SPOEX|nr:hypothetical protein HF086_004462 [Spodoptera exigua]